MATTEIVMRVPEDMLRRWVGQQVERLQAEVDSLNNEVTEILLPLVTWLLDNEPGRYAGRHCIDVAVELLTEQRAQREAALGECDHYAEALPGPVLRIRRALGVTEGGAE